MSPPFCYDHPRPAVTVDLVVFAVLDSELRVLLICRKHDPFAGRWAIPGGFLNIDEPIEAAARRELHEETGLDVVGPVVPIGVFGDPGRDPRGRTISLAHAAVLRQPQVRPQGGDDAEEACWIAPAPTLELAFDHDAILDTALGWLRRGVTEEALGLALLPVEFGDDEVRMLYCAIGAPARLAVPWRKRMERERRIHRLSGADGRFHSIVVPEGGYY